MQRLILFILPFILAERSLALGNDDLLQKVNQVYLLSEEMITHGGEGHTHEIITFGEKMIHEMDGLSDLLHSTKIPNRKKVRALMKEARRRAEEAVLLAKNGMLQMALKSAKSASFHAKKLREELRAVKK